MDTGLCWGFSANTSLETNLALNNKEYDFSERHLEYNTANNLIKEEENQKNEDALNRYLGSGGYSSTAFTYYSRGSGPILEEDMPFENNENPIEISKVPTNSVIQKVNNMVYFPNVYKYKDENNNLVYVDANGEEYTKSEVQAIRNQVKEHIMNNGGVTTSILAPHSYYNGETCAANLTVGETFSNHAVTIIGWDDEYKVENFLDQPSEPGAYIVLNSWGEYWGNSGVYYISYEDCLVESEMIGVIGVSDVEYDNLYQHDTSEVWNCSGSKYAANVFTSKNDEVLKEVMISSLSEQTCDIYVNALGDDLNINNLTKVAGNINLRPGYNTIELEDDIELSKGNKFAIVVEITSDSYSGIGIEDNTAYFGNVVSHENESFISDDGENWTDIYDEYDMMNLSIKAYTQTKEKNFEVSEITGKGYDELGGNYSLSIKTSHLEKGNIVDISIYDNNNNKIEGSIVKGNTIRGNGTHITLEFPSNLSLGEYFVDIKLSDFETVRKSFTLSEISDDLITIQFEDENFLKYIRGKLQNSFYNKEKMQLITTQESIDKITSLNDGDFREITNITGIEYFTNLEDLNLMVNNISSIEKLENLKNLKWLNLYSNNITGFSAIETLTNLEYLDISQNQINNFDFLANLTKLEYLDISQNQINNLDFLANLVKLDYLDLTASIKEKIDISNIFTLTNLQTLILHGTEWLTENELTMINNLTNLENLDLTACNIGNIEFLRGMNLNSLNIGNYSSILAVGNNTISDLSPIEDMTSLTQLNLNKLKNLESLKGIENLNKLDCLWVEYGYLRDASSLDSETFANKDFWSNLWLPNNEIYDIVYVNDTDTIIAKVPKIFEQASNTESLLYSPDGISLYGCEWDEYGKTIKFNINSDYQGDPCIRINSGYAKFSQYFVKAVRLNVTDIELSKSPNKTDYALGEDLDLSGGKLFIQNELGNTEEISMLQTGVNIVNYDNTQLGEQIVTVEYAGMQTQFDINVTNELEKLEWYIDGEKIIKDEKGYVNINLGESKEIKLYGITENGERVDLSKESSIYSKDENIIKIENGIINTLDCGTVEISFLNNTNNLKLPEELIINVVGIKTIEIVSLPEKTSYRVDETIDLTGGILSITNLDDTIEEIPMTDENIQIRVIGLEDLEEYNPKVELTYKGRSIEIDIYRDTSINFREIDKIIDNQFALETIDTINIESDADLSKLDYLKLFNNVNLIWMSYIDLQDISILNELEPNGNLSININGGSINFRGINNQKITNLGLYFCEVSNLKEINNLKELRRLDIGNINGYEELDYRQFENLEFLSISGQEVQNYPELLTSLSKLENMRVLSLTTTNLNDKDTEYLAQIKTLQELYIEDTYVTDISFLRNLNNLQYLSLPYGISDLSVIYELKSLYNLNVDGYTEINMDSNLINYLDRNSIWYTEFDKDISNKIGQIVEELEIAESMTDEEKVRKVTEYVVEYMNYWGEKVFEWPILDSAINNKSGTEEYAMLEYVLLKKVGIEAYYVDGYFGGAWNIVKLNGKWYGIDVAQIDFYEENDELEGIGWEMYYLKNPVSDGDANNYMFASSHKAYVNPYDDDRTLAGIEITTNPTKTEYVLGEDLDFTGGIITLTYYNGETEEIAMTSEGVNQPGIYDKTVIGEQSIEIEYLNHRTTLKINVVSDIVGYQWRINDEVVTEDIVGIQIKEDKEYKIELYEIKQNGEEVCLNNVTDVNIYSIDSEIATYDSTTRNLKGAKAGYTQLYASIEISPEAGGIVAVLPIRVYGILGIRTSFSNKHVVKGEELDLTNETIVVMYEDSTVEYITLPDDRVQIRGFNNMQLGPQEVTVTYKGHTTTFAVNIITDDKEEPFKLDFKYENETLQLNKMGDIEYLSGFDLKSKGTTVDTFINTINISNENEKFEIKIYDEDKEIEGNKLVGTGSKIKIYLNNEIIKEYIVVYYGDTDGNGVINAIDALAIIKNKSGKVPFENEIYTEAARITGNTEVPSAIDALAIVKYATGRYNINQTK